jgi:hypothetical protein
MNLLACAPSYEPSFLELQSYRAAENIGRRPDMDRNWEDRTLEAFFCLQFGNEHH